jgi:hypothetical protein
VAGCVGERSRSVMAVVACTFRRGHHSTRKRAECQSAHCDPGLPRRIYSQRRLGRHPLTPGQLSHLNTRPHLLLLIYAPSFFTGLDVPMIQERLLVDTRVLIYERILLHFLSHPTRINSFPLLQTRQY